ncbi:MAG: DUF3352 domain-containing protein [Candidatus Viridilinea halotolerans]|uniref:DUF3352 domain-containing protein n=1 Tax=Candidatus Viridilinea halotolerans TaxID=2491704 RepID=A0A426TXK1_9CHLR|nr:MAG: DUF3352 domain-containing protein [Candidatus Viridilinea halotolerans]
MCMHNQLTATTTTPTPTHPPRERGLGYVFLGGLGITLVAIVIGTLAFGWLLLAARGPAVPDMLAADTQLYLALAPNVGHVVDVAQLRQILSQELAITEYDGLLQSVVAQAVVPLGPDNMGIWLGSELGVAIRGAKQETLAGGDLGADLLATSEILIFFSSKNDPQAESFLEEHHAARVALGETFTVETLGDVTIVARSDGPPSPTHAFALIEHYVFFSNRREALVALAERAAQAGEVPVLATQPHFSQAAAGRYSDGSADAVAARVALSALLRGMLP